MKNLKTIGLGTSVAAILAMTSLEADAVSFGFSRITANASQNVASQLSVDVTDAGSGKVDFTFRNVVGIASSITDIYFDDGTIFTSGGITSITDSGAGVAFAKTASPGNLPSGNTINFVNSGNNFSADSDSPVSANGVSSASEWLKITFTLLSGKTFNDALSALQWGLDHPNNTSDGLRIGLHVQSIGTSGKSDSFVNGPRKSVPDAGSTFALLGLGAGALALARRKMV